MRDFGHATPGTMTPFCVINTRKNGLQIMSLAAYACEPNKKRGNTKTTIQCEKVISDPHLMIEMFQEIKRIFFFKDVSCTHRSMCVRERYATVLS